MAAPTYANDLTTIATGENTTNYGALGGGGAGLSASPDLSTEGTNAVDKQITNSNKGIEYDNGSAVALGADEHIFIRMFCGTPGLVDTLVNEGVVVLAGNTNTNYVVFHVEGSDTYGAVSRTGKCYCFRYVTTASGVEPYRTLYGSPSGNPRFFGAKLSTTASVKGANLGLDVMRYGRGFFITDGDAATPATFAGAAAISDALNSRLGILTGLGGKQYELQGRFVVGRTPADVPTAGYFESNSAIISIVDTPHSLPDFTQFIIDHASSVFRLINVTVNGLGANNPGRLEFVNSGSTGDLTGGSWNDFGESILNAGVVSVGTAWRGSDQVTQNGATLTRAIIEGSIGTSGIVIDNLSLIDDLRVTDCGNYGIDLTSSTSTSITLTDIIATGNTVADIVVDNAADVVLNLNGSSNVGTAINIGAGNVSIVSGLITLEIAVTDEAKVPIPDARVYAVFSDNLSVPIISLTTNAQGVVQQTVSYTSDKILIGWARSHDLAGIDYETENFTGTVTSNGLQLTVELEETE